MVDALSEEDKAKLNDPVVFKKFRKELENDMNVSISFSNTSPFDCK